MCGRDGSFVSLLYLRSILKKICMHRLLLALLYTLLYLSPITAGTAGRQQVSILTCSPGDQVYELFGHTAIRVTDVGSGADVVFNYGLFSFDEPGFVWRFVRGETDYLLGATDYPYFFSEYEGRGSGIVEQVLNLDSAQAAGLVRALVYNASPQHRKYRYNFLTNNCTTKARDMIYKAYGGTGRVQYSKASLGDSLSFRDIVHMYTVGNPWYTLGIDMLLGAPADTLALRSGAQFAPFVFMNELDGAYITESDDTVYLVAQHRELLMPQKTVHSRNNLTPFNASLLLLLFTFVVMLCERRSKRIYWGWDLILMGLQGLAGCILTLMVFLSQHPTVNVNWLLLWLNPLPVILLPFLVYNVIKGKSLFYVSVLQMLPAAAFVLLSPLLPQVFPVALYPCAIAVIVRSLFHIYRKKICAFD